MKKQKKTIVDRAAQTQFINKNLANSLRRPQHIGKKMTLKGIGEKKLVESLLFEGCQY